jgi:hypothetical protein
MEWIREHLTYANVMVTILSFVVLGGGAYAVTTAKKNSVTSKSVMYSSLKGADVLDDSLTGNDVDEGTLSLPAGPKGDKGDTGAAGSARAYGLVSETGVVSRSKNVVGNATRPSTGTYCITLDPSIDPSTAVLLTGADYDGNDTSLTDESISVAEWSKTNGSCPGKFAVVTFAYLGDPIDNDTAAGGNTLGDNLEPTDEPFVFMVP